MTEFSEILDKDNIISHVYDQIKHDIVQYGTTLVLKDLGFVVNEFNNKCKIQKFDKDSKFDLLSDLQTTKTIEEFATKLKKEIHEEVIKKIISNEMFDELKKTVVNTIIEDSKMYLRQQIQSEIQKQYYDFIKKEFIKDLMYDPKFKEFKLSQL